MPLIEANAREIITKKEKVYRDNKTKGMEGIIKISSY